MRLFEGGEGSLGWWGTRVALGGRLVARIAANSNKGGGVAVRYEGVSREVCVIFYLAKNERSIYLADFIRQKVAFI